MLLTGRGVDVPLDEMRVVCPTGRAGSMRDLARRRGADVSLVSGSPEILQRELDARRPVLVGLIVPDAAHYAVVTGFGDRHVVLVDPALGRRVVDRREFDAQWDAAGHLAILLRSSVESPALEEFEAGNSGFWCACAHAGEACARLIFYLIYLVGYSVYHAIELAVEELTPDQTAPPPLPSSPTAAHTAPIHSIAYSPDGARMASAGGDGTVKIWSAHTQQLLRSIAAHDGSVLAVTWNRDVIVTAGDDRTIRWWSAESGEELRRIETPSAVSSLASDGDRVVAGLLDGGVWIQDRGTFSPLEKHGAGVTGVALHGARVASCGFDDVVRIRKDGAEIWRDECRGARTVSFSPDGNYLVAAGDASIRLWKDGNRLEEWTDHDGTVFCLAFSPDGKRLAAGGRDGTVRVWDVEEGDLLETFEDHRGAVLTVCFSPDGRKLASAGTDRVIRAR
jgi:hypothetical protein